MTDSVSDISELKLGQRSLYQADLARDSSQTGANTNILLGLGTPPDVEGAGLCLTSPSLKPLPPAWSRGY